MNNLQFIKEHKKEVQELLEIDKLKKEMEMFEFLKKCFQNDDSKLDELQKSNDRLQQEIDTLKGKNEKLKANYDESETKNDTLAKELQKLQGSPLQRVEELYNSLDISTKKGLKTTLYPSATLTLFSSAILHIEPLWEYAKYLLQKEEMQEFFKIKEIFYVVFESYKDVEGLIYQPIEIGDEFESKLHIRDNHSKPSGEIKEIFLKGFCKNSKVIKQSIVSVS